MWIWSADARRVERDWVGWVTVQPRTMAMSGKATRVHFVLWREATARVELRGDGISNQYPPAPESP